MTPRSLFNIILKVLGIFFIQDFLAAIPQLLSVFLYAFTPEARQEAIWALVSALLLLFAYGIVSFYLIFRTAIIIDKLKLDKGFDQEAFPLNIHRSTVLSISIIVIGGLIVVDEIPNFCRQLVSYYQAKRMTMGWQTQPSWISYIVLSGVKIIVGVLMLSNQRQIVRFIEWKRRT
jgi:hypothetical protein